MFCLLTVNKRKDGFLEQVFGSIIKDEYELVTVPVIKGAPFFHLIATVGKNGVDFERVIYEVGRCAEKLIIDGEVDLPRIKGINEFQSDLLYEKIKDNTANYLMQKSDKDIEYNKNMGLIICENDIIKIGQDRNDFTLPNEYNRLIPLGVDKYIFASALYELCGVFSLGTNIYNSVIVNGEKKSIESVIFS